MMPCSTFVCGGAGVTKTFSRAKKAFKRVVVSIEKLINKITIRTIINIKSTS